MFDEYVEHPSAPPALSPVQRGALPQLQYEGFEPIPTADDRPFGAPGMVPPPVPSESALIDAKPMFELGRVQHTLPAPLVSLTVSSDVLTMALRTNTLQQLNLADNDSVNNITLPRSRGTPDLTIYKIFSDPSGKHLLITTEQGQNFYCYEGWTQARLLTKFKLVVESVAWNTVPSPSSSAAQPSYSRTSTREILLGARNGTIYEVLLDAHNELMRSHDRYIHPLFSMPDKQPITGIRAECFPATTTSSTAAKRAVVIVTTASRIYQFSGQLDRKSDETSGRLYESLFAAYKDTAPKFLELPGVTSHSELHVFTPTSTRPVLPKSMAWLTGPGIYHGGLNFSNSSSDDVIDSAALLPYPNDTASSTINTMALPANAVPVSIGLTEFHFLMLYRDRIVAVGNVDERLVYEELLPLKPDEKPIGLASDPTRKTYWVYTDSSMFELLVHNDDRDMWRVYLEKGMHELALQYSKTPSQRALVNASLGDHYFGAGSYIQAAQSYAQSSKSFEEVALAFGDAGERDALRYYLVCKLERLAKNDVIQRMMLATWLVEFYLSKLNTLDDLVASEGVSHDVDNLLAERSMVEDELRQFFETYKGNLDKKTVYELILSHGRISVFLHYATVIGDHGRVVEHYVMEEDWLKAVDVLNRQHNLELYYRFSPALMRHAPKETVDSWLRQPLLDPHRLIPALLQSQHVPPSPLSPNHAIRYLQHVIFNAHSTSHTIYNLLLTLLISSPSPAAASPVISATDASQVPGNSETDLPLLRFLSTAPTDPLTSEPYYDLDYALRLCKQHGKLQACVHIYAQMGMWEESVDLALEMGELDLAKVNADRPEEDEVLRKKLWLKVARYVVQDKKDIRTAMRFLDNTSVLKIEDILPFFPDFVVIDDFKEEICTALEGYSSHIESLKSEMDEATRNAESIKRDIADLKNKFVTLEENELCSHCDLLLLTRQFYVFPCQHTFHADCLIGLVKEYFPPHILRKIIALQTELVRLSGESPERSTTPQPQRTLLSAAFAPNALARAAVDTAGAVIPSRKALTAAGDRLRDLIAPAALAGTIGMWGGRGDKVPRGVQSYPGDPKDSASKLEKLREELDDLLASSCPLCESVVAGLDKPFIAPGEVDSTWEL